jgi:DNA invertase Pin-like site-specific DNA recombinase
MEKIGLLYRVSSKPQETDGGGLEVQKRMGEKMSEKLGLLGVEFNEGVQSSFKVEINQRPKLVELLDEIQKPNGIRKVWVFNTDRLGRYSNSWYSILKVFMDYGVEIYIGEDLNPYDLSSSVDKLTISILSSISQYDNELRRMRSILGKRNKIFF